MIEIRIPDWLVRFWWTLNDRCDECGGELLVWSWNKAYCKKCHKKQ